MTEEFTTIPNVYIDEYMSELSGAEFKVLLAVLYRTVGCQKESDEISLSQLERITGLTRHSVIDGLRRLIERGLVVQTQEARGIRAASYRCVVPEEER